MKELKEFGGQNWLITPAALAVGQPQPANIHQQLWLLVLTGVVVADFKGNSGAWLGQTLSFLPDMSGPESKGGSGPLVWAIDHFPIPKPPPTPNHNICFSVEQGAPFASLSSIFDQNQSINAGYAVNTWRWKPFEKTRVEPGATTFGNDVVTNQPVANIFTGIHVDVAVRDVDAHILRIGYHITLLGRIVFPALNLG